MSRGCKYMEFSTEQERFWQTEFGDDYASRNRGPELVAANTALFSTVLRNTTGVSSVLELGSNVGLNLLAIQSLIPSIDITAVEINHSAGEELLRSLPDADLHETSILEFEPTDTFDLVFTKGVLIHIDPAMLPKVYDLMYAASNRYVLVAEYYNPVPVELTYRGHSEKLFKRDFAGELLDRFENLRLIDYGFVYHRDPNFPLDDENWFLMEKR